MIIYNVTVKVDNDVAEAWVQWMKAVHMADLMSTGLFLDCRLCRLLEQDDTEGLTYTAQYFLESIAGYNAYIDRYAQMMRDKFSKQFGSKCTAFRTVMEVV